MNNLFNSNLSIEKMAAYLDGNLPEKEMQDVSSVIDNDEDMQMFTQMNDLTDQTLAGYTEQEMELPIELQSTDFDIPSFNSVSPEFEPFVLSLEDHGHEVAVCCPENPTEEVPFRGDDSTEIEDTHTILDNGNIGTMGHDDGMGYNGEDF